MRSVLFRRVRPGPLAGALAATAMAATAMVPMASVAHAAVACSVTYTTTDWSTGFTGNVTLKNEGDALNGWRLTWTFADGQRVQQMWSAKYTQSGAQVTATNEAWNGNVPTGGSVSFGFNGSKTGTQNRVPVDFAVNGTSCTGANKAPTAALTSPANNSSYTSGSTIPLAATATDTDGTISKVEFYNGTTLLGSDTTAPYTHDWANAPVGQHSLAARAYDNRNATGDSTPIAVTVIGQPTVVASPSTVNVRQGRTATFGVRLATQPSGPVTVTVARTAGSTDLTAAPATLSFTTTDWSTAKNVTVTSADNGGTAATATFTASATGHTAATISVKEIVGGSDYTAAFLEQYNKIKDPSSGYFRNFGGLLVPYHSVETLLVEAPDHGHQTTSEAFSYYLWLEAAYGRVQGDWTPFNQAWASLEKFIIPAKVDQPTNDKYDPSKPATYAPEHSHPSRYPSQLDTSVPVGQDPIANELKTAYGTSDIYGMHWLLDVDNTLGFGRCGDGTTAPSYINTYQRGSQESVWETIPQPSCDTFAHGGQYGFLDLFTKDTGTPAKQWKFTNAPDADARAVQVAYLANQWATEQGKQAQIAATVQKASKMGDYLRYAMFDKYFKRIGNCTSPTTCPGGTGKSSAHYLMSWYYAWGGATDTSAGWAWRIGDGANHQGYQNPLAAYAMANDPALKPKSATGQADWATSLTRQLQFIKWLQSAEGGIAGGATNSWDGQYGPPPAGLPTFNGMFYDYQPVWHDPPSNRWFGFQVWGMERIAALYQETGNAQAKEILDKWVPWAIQNTEIGTGGAFRVPSDMTWTGTPEANFTSTASNWPAANTKLHVTVDTKGQDVGVAAALAKTLLHYAARSGNAAARTTGEGLLNAMLQHTTTKGIAIPETRGDYSRFDDRYVAGGDGTYVPPGWTGKMPNGDTIDSNATFLSIRSFYRNDPDWPKVQAHLDGGPAPVFTYHRFWAQAEIATAFAAHVELFGGS